MEVDDRVPSQTVIPYDRACCKFYLLNTIKKSKKKQEDGNESTKGTESDRNSSDANNEIMVLKQE